MDYNKVRGQQIKFQNFNSIGQLYEDHDYDYKFSVNCGIYEYWLKFYHVCPRFGFSVYVSALNHLSLIVCDITKCNLSILFHITYL